MAKINKKRLLSIIAIGFLIALSFVPRVPVSASPDEVIPAGETVTIEDGAVHSYSDNIIVYGTFIIRNGSTLTLSQTHDYQYIIDVREGGQLIVENSTINSPGHWFYLYCRYESSLTMANSTVNDASDVYVQYTSSINAVNTTLGRFLYIYYNSNAELTGVTFSQSYSYVTVYYRSETTITDSEFYDLDVGYTSKAVVEDSKITYIYSWYESNVSVTGSETYYFNMEYLSYGSIENSTVVNNGGLYAYYGSVLVADHVVAEEGEYSWFCVGAYYSYNKVYISNSAGIYRIELYYGDTYCLLDNVTMESSGDIDVSGESTLEVIDSTVGDYAWFSHSIGKFTNVVSVNGLDLEAYRGSEVYVTNLTYLGDVDIHGGSHVMLDTVNMTSDADIDLSYGGPTLKATNSELGDYLCADGGELTLINVTLSDPDLDDGSFYVEYGAVAYLDNMTLSDWDYFEVYEGAKAWIMNSNLTGRDDSDFYVDGGVELFVEDSTINFAYGYIYSGAIAKFYNCDITIDPYDLEIYSGAIAEFYNCPIFANESISVYKASIITLVNCEVSAFGDSDPYGIWLEEASTAIFQNTDLDGTLYVSDLPNITVIDSILNINYTGNDLNATQWLHLFDSTANVTDLEIYHLHNHLNASTIDMLGNTTYREVRYGISGIVEDDYGEPIPGALVEIYDSSDNLIFTGYTDSNGKSEEIFPNLGTYTIKAYADSEMDTASVTLTDICIEESFILDITNPIIGTVTQNPPSPDYTENVAITAEVSDPSGIQSVTLYYNNGTEYSVPMSHVSGDLYSGTIPAQAYNTHISYYITAKDNSNNLATSDTYTYIVIDDILPSVNITSPADNADVWGIVAINFTASDDYLDTVFLYIDSSEFNVTGQTSFEWNSTTVGDGSYTIRISATDRAGNNKEMQITVTTTNLARANAQIDDLEGQVDDLEGQVDNLEGSVGTWQMASAATALIGLLVGAAIVYFMKRR